MEEKTLLDVENLVVNFYTYEGIVEAIDNVFLDMKSGETLGLVGETGCGKSVTSLSVLVLVPPPGRVEQGKVYFRGKDGKTIDLLSQEDSFLRAVRGRFISMIFQEPRAALNPVYSVEDQIAEVLLLHRQEEFIENVLKEIEQHVSEKGSRSFVDKFESNIYRKMLKNRKAISLRILSRIPIVNRYKRRLKKEVRKEVVRILKEMKIPDPDRVVDMYPHELSGGMAQRVVIAMALGCTPELLIADEPTTNLDVTIQAQILALIRELKGKFESSVLYITHDLGVIAELCDRVAVMYAGNVCEIADVMEIFKDPLHPYTQGLLESIPRPGVEFKSIEGEVPALINPPHGCRFHTRCPKAMEICRTAKPRQVEAKKEHYVTCHLYAGS